MNRGLILIAVALLVTACGSSVSSSSKGAASTSTSTSTSARHVSPPGETANAGGAGTVTSQAHTQLPPCVAADLSLSFLGQQGGLGHGLLGFTLRNKSASSCRTGGYPGVLFLDSSGRGLTTASQRVTHDFFGTAPVVPIVLDPGQSTSFRLGTTHVPQGSATCTTAAALQVIPPNDTATLKTTIPNGAYECQALTVSPLRPGVSAYP
jgi:hypothetical protein